MFEPLKFDRRRTRVKHCPCGRNNRDGKFAPYVGHDNKGYCHSCGKTFLPEFSSTCHAGFIPASPARVAISNRSKHEGIPECLKAPPAYNSGGQAGIRYDTTFHSDAVFQKSLTHPCENHLVQYFCRVLGVEVTRMLIETYCIGTARHWQGATVFWQIDTQYNVCSGKIMLYTVATGKRVKALDATWVHSVLKLKDFKMKQCFFGEHLLNRPENKRKQVAVVESEKTAMIASVRYPECVWLACGGLTHLNATKCRTLYGRNVRLYPDANGFDQWKKIAGEHNFEVSDYLEKLASDAEKKDGLDVADWLVG